MAQAEDHDVVDERFVQLDVQHPVGADQVVRCGQRLPPGIFHGSILLIDAIDQKHIVPAHLAVLFHPAGLIQQIEHPPDAAADVAHALALAGVIGGEGGVERTVDVAHRLSRHAVVLRIQVHLDHSLGLFLPKQTFQRRVFVHCLFVGAAQESVIHRAEQLAPERQLVPAAVLQLMPAHHHFHLCRQADALGLAHHLPVAECAGQALVDAGG